MYIINILNSFLFFVSFNFYFVDSNSNSLKTYSINSEKLIELHNSYLNKKLEENEAFQLLINKADDLLTMKPVSVIDKSPIPPSEDKHDYMSMGPYWWPNPDTENGLPYIRKDGERNPEINQITDHANERKMTDAVYTLSLAYYITGESKYSSKASQLLRIWYINDSTKMNPNLNYAQGIPGICTGRGIGIIELSSIYKIIDAIKILETSNSWTEMDDEKIYTWFDEYLNWLTTSQYGIDELNWENNHGSWYDVQTASVSLFLGKDDLARKIIERAKTKRIDLHIESDGKQPLELERTKSWSYSVFNLNALFLLAYLGEHVEVDLWNYENPKGGSLAKALDYILPFTLNMDEWKYEQIQKIDIDSIIPLIQLAEKKINKNLYSDWKKKLFDGKEKKQIFNLLY
ncbi:MAG: alginate lyase family protein [Ignavibacteriales bacterium]|nr:alginate lyase family protein [Ignavibacteriales bacterium]